MAYSGDEATNKSAPLPPYSEMILTAIAELGEKQGSTKQSISNQIEAVYGNRLPENHYDKLSDALAELKESGKLVFKKNCYAPPGRGRGRGRPPGVKQGSVVQKESQPLSTSAGVKKRGRPKNPKQDVGDSPSPVAVSAEETASSKRGRGRPPKARP